MTLTYAWQYFKKNAEATRKTIELEKSLLVSRLEILKGQLNTHFLFNTLHTISSLVVRNKNEEANRMLVKLSDLLRFALKENNDQLIPLARELEILGLYLDIQKERFKERLSVEFNVAETLDQALIPAMLLQPVVENAVRYAIEPYSEKGTINIHIADNNGRLKIVVSDNGPVPFKTINFNTGIGLHNCKERLRQLFGEDYVFRLEANGYTGTRVCLELPLELSKNGTN